MIRKIMICAAMAAGFITTINSAQAQERRQVMLDKVVAVVEYRDGTVIDVIRQIKR